MKFLLPLLLFVLASCSNVVAPVTPVSPVVPINPNAPQHATGYIRKAGSVGLSPGAPFILADRVAQIPQSFSWVAAGKATPTRDQASCGSCWAFGSVQMLDGAVKIFDGKDMTLSEQEVVAYDKNSMGCSGGDFAGDFLVQNGLVLDSACPYTASNGGCKGGKPTTFAAKPLGTANVGTGHGSPSVVQLQEAILEYGVIACDVAADSAWDNYSGGILKGKDSGIDHIVAVVGWDGQGNWIMKNSWGSSWGEKTQGSTDGGYARVPYGNFSLCADAALLKYSSIPAQAMLN